MVNAMSKRFTDSNKWDDPFFIDLPNKYKLLWVFMLDKCDHAGIYQHSKRLSTFFLGYEYEKEQILSVFNGRVIVLDSGKWFIKKYIDFQYGELKENNRVHVSVMTILEKEGAYKGLISPMETAKDKDKDKDKDKVKYKDNVLLLKKEHDTLIEKYGEEATEWMIDKLSNYKLSKGKKYKSDYGAINTWVVDDAKKKGIIKEEIAEF